MANVDRPNGFRPIGTLAGGPWTSLIRVRQVGDASADTTGSHGHIFVGDPIKDSSGKALAANSGDAILGVVVGVGKKSAEHGEVGMFDPTSNDTGLYVPLSETSSDSAWYVFYVPADLTLFEVQTATDLDLTLGAEADFSTDAGETHGSTTTGISSAELVADSNSDVVVVAHNTAPDNDTTLANARHIVKFRNTVYTAPMPTS